MKRILLSVLMAIGLLQPVLGEPGWNPDEVKKKAVELLKAEDFAALDTLAATIRQQGYDIRQSYPELRGFYSAFDVKEGANEREWLDQQGKLTRWSQVRPESLAAKIALANWYLNYGWKARGTAYANQVSDEGWKLMRERLHQSAQILKSVPEGMVDDPEYYRTWIYLETEPGESNADCGKTAVIKGSNLAKEYYPLYSDRAYFLLPKWFGNPGDWERFLLNTANSFSGEKGDILYARIARAEAHHYGENFFKESQADYARIKRGYLAGAVYHNANDRPSDLSNLAYLATIQGDNATAVKLLLDLGGSVYRSAFGTDDNFNRLRKASGAEAIINKALEAERSGKLDEAEKQFLSFHPDLSTSSWMISFYIREGMEAKLRPLRFSDQQSFAQILDADPSTTSDINTLAELSKLAPLVGQWEKAEAAGNAFNQKRGFNLIGKNALWICALHKGNREGTDAARQQFLELKTNRPAYLAAQALVAGTKTWEETRAELKPTDVYTPQAVTAIALHYYSIGQTATAHQVIEEMLPVCQETIEKRLLESLLYGSLGRSLAQGTSPAPGR